MATPLSSQPPMRHSAPDSLVGAEAKDSKKKALNLLKHGEKVRRVCSRWSQNWRKQQKWVSKVLLKLIKPTLSLSML